MIEPFGYEERFAVSLRKMVLPTALCRPHPENARLHNLPAIAESLRNFGQQTPIVVQQSTGYIVKGNGTWEAATTLLGWANLAQSWEEFPDDIALAYLAADNKASDDSRYERTKQTQLLRHLANLDRLGLSLWNADELDDYEVGEQAILTEVEQFTGDYADAASGVQEQRAERSATGTGQKMRELPIVLTTEQAAQFTTNVDTLQKFYGTTGRIATIFRALQDQADLAAGKPTLLDAEEQRKAILTDLRNYFSQSPTDPWTRIAIVAYLQMQIAPALQPLRPDLRQTEAFDVAG